MAKEKRLGYTKELECPECQSTQVESVPFFYKSLQSRNAGKQLFLEQSYLPQGKELTFREREKLIHHLTPPEEPRRNLPAGLIAFMAFLISWLATSGILAHRLKQEMIFIVSAVLIAVIFVPYVFVLNQVIAGFIKSHIRYRRIMAVWNKQFICKDCQKIFIPKSD